MDHAAEVTELHYQALNAEDPQVIATLNDQIAELCIDLTAAEMVHATGIAVARWSTQ